LPNQDFMNLAEIVEALEKKEQVKYNPFKTLPKESLLEAKKLLDEYSKELT
jgi:hypothetical protein